MYNIGAETAKPLGVNTSGYTDHVNWYELLIEEAVNAINTRTEKQLDPGETFIPIKFYFSSAFNCPKYHFSWAGYTFLTINEAWLPEEALADEIADYIWKTYAQFRLWRKRT